MEYPSKISHNDFCAAINQIFETPDTDLYQQLNAMRDWVNAYYPEFELYLEDVWNERTKGETHLEYILRSRRTLNETEPLGYDIYLNHQDANGVWHLDDYTGSVRLFADPSSLFGFIEANSSSQ